MNFENEIQIKNHFRATYQSLPRPYTYYINFRFFNAYVMDGSVTPIEWPSRHPHVVLDLAVNIYYDYETQI